MIGTAAVGALLQNRLAVSLTNQARTRTTGLPPSARDHLIAGFSATAHNGIGIGAGQGGSSVSLPTGVPVQLAREIEHIAQAIFTNGFVDAMRSTMLMPIVVLVVGAVSCLLIKRTPTAPSLAAAGAHGGAPAVAARWPARQRRPLRTERGPGTMARWCPLRTAYLGSLDRRRKSPVSRQARTPPVPTGRAVPPDRARTGTSS